MGCDYFIYLWAERANKSGGGLGLLHLWAELPFNRLIQAAGIENGGYRSSAKIGKFHSFRCLPKVQKINN